MLLPVKRTLFVCGYLCWLCYKRKKLGFRWALSKEAQEVKVKILVLYNCVYLWNGKSELLSNCNRFTDAHFATKTHAKRKEFRHPTEGWHREGLISRLQGIQIQNAGSDIRVNPKDENWTNISWLTGNLLLCLKAWKFTQSPKWWLFSG